MIIRILKSLFGTRETSQGQNDSYEKPLNVSPANTIYKSNLGADNKNILMRAVTEGRVLLLKNNDEYYTAVPIALDGDMVSFIHEETHKKFEININNVKIEQESYCLVTKEECDQNLSAIKSRTSDSILEIEYWNDEFISVYDEELVFVNMSNTHINMEDPETHKSLSVRIPFLRSIIFEGQTQRELLEKVNQPLSKYDGYRYYDAAIDAIKGRKPIEVAKCKDLQDIQSLLLKVIEDKTISPNIHASAYRILGELSECQKGIDIALDFYEKAINANPKIGVKRKISQLKILLNSRETKDGKC